MALSKYQRYVVEYGKYISNMQEKHGTEYRNLPGMYNEEDFKMAYRAMQAIRGGEGGGNYVRDIVRTQFGRWKTKSTIAKAVYEWQKSYAKELGLTQKAAKERGIIAQKMSDIEYKTAAGAFVTDQFYNAMERRARELREQGKSSYDIGRIIGWEFYGSE